MCDPELLQELLPLQVKLNKLYCTLNSSCWCNQLSYKYPLNQMPEKCMSPREILDDKGSELSLADKKYLEYLSHKEFIGT